MNMTAFFIVYRTPNANRRTVPSTEKEQKKPIGQPKAWQYGFQLLVGAPIARGMSLFQAFLNIINITILPAFNSFHLKFKQIREYSTTKHSEILTAFWGRYCAHKYYTQIENFRNNNLVQIAWIIVRFFFYAFVCFFFYSVKAKIALFP